MRKIRLSIFLAVVAFAMAVPRSRAAESSPDAAKSLAEQLGGMKDTRTLEASFVCEKRLAMLDTPLVSSGRIWIKQGDPHEGDGAVRFSTDKPYVSELILAGGKVLARSQHESEWTKTNQSSRPGLTAVMGELGGWSTGGGGGGKLSDEYTITAGNETIPKMPAVSDHTKTPAKNKTLLFVLTPTNKDLLKAVKSITIGIDPSTHHLRYIEILTQQNDTTRYWFYDVKTNPDLPRDIFGPTQAPPASQPKSAKP